MKITYLLLLSCLTGFLPLQGELEQIVVVWRAGNCDRSCEEEIVRQLENRPEIESANVIPGAGQAVIKWKPETPFSYSPINIAMRRVGPSIQRLQLVVRGQIKDDGRNIVLISEGDGTSFVLLNPTGALEVGAPVQGTVRGRELTEEQRTQLLGATAEGRAVTVSGIVFNPFRAPPLMLVISDVSIGKPPKKAE